MRSQANQIKKGVNSINLNKKLLGLNTPLKSYKKILPSKGKNHTFRYLPAAIRVFLNSVYSYNKSFVKNLPQADNTVYKIIKSYFTLNLLSNNIDGKRSKLLARRYKRLSLNRIIVSKPEIKHSADHVMITLYVYNKKKHSLIYRLKHLYKSIMWGKAHKHTSLKAQSKNNFEFLPKLGMQKKIIKKALSLNSKKILNLILKKRNKKVLNLRVGKVLKKKLITLKTAKKLVLKRKLNKYKSLNIKKSNNTLIVNTRNRYNLKMNYLLDQDREYTASYRSFNYAKKRIYILMGRKFNMYKINKGKDLLNVNNITKKIRKNIFKLSVKALPIKVYKKKALMALKNKKALALKIYLKKRFSIRKSSIKFVTNKLLNIKPRIKSVKLRWNKVWYRNWTYINKKKRSTIFKRYKAKIIHVWTKRGDTRTKKIYNNALLFKAIRTIIFKPLPLLKVAFQSKIINKERKNKVLLFNKKKFENLPVKNYNKGKLVIRSTDKYQQGKLLIRPVHKYYKGDAVMRSINFIRNVMKNPLISSVNKTRKNRNILNNLYKSKFALKKSYVNTNVKLNSLAMRLKANNKYKTSLKSMYKPYKVLDTNKLNRILLLNNLKELDLTFNEKTMEFNKGLSDILQQDSITNPYINENNIELLDTKQVNYNYLELKNLWKFYLINKLLRREFMYTDYIKSLYNNNLAFKTGFINSLCNIISKVYNKKVKLNIVSLKYLFLNSDILSQTVSLRLKNHRKNRISKVLNKVFGLVYLAKINEYSYNRYSPIYQYMNNFDKKYKHLRSQLAFTTKTKNSKVNLIKDNTHEKLSGMPLYNLNHILFNQMRFIKCRSVFGIKIEAKGRLSKRSTAARKIFKAKYLGNLRFNTTLNNDLSAYLIKNNMISNLQFTKIAGKTRIGSFGVKGWVNNN